MAGQDLTAKIQDRLIDLILIDNRGFEADQLDLTDRKSVV
jgi:phage protein D